MNKNSIVDEWFAHYDNPMNELVQAVREAVLAADERIEETTKWQAPTFFYKGNTASFFQKAKKHASLMFHKGKFIPGNFPNLEGDGKEARSMKFKNLQELDAKKRAGSHRCGMVRSARFVTRMVARSVAIVPASLAPATFTKQSRRDSQSAKRGPRRSDERRASQIE